MPFKVWRSSVPPERETDALLAGLEVLAVFYQDTLKAEPNFEALWRLAHPPRVPGMYRNSFDLKLPQLKAAWQKVAGSSEGARLHDEALTHFRHVDRCYRALLGKIATALVSTLSTHIDEVLNDYAQFKRKAAVLDFDDLLYCARDVVKAHEKVRSALGQRFLRILVDEFQDTDPIQAEILFRIAAIDRPERWQDSTLRDGALFMVGDPKQAIYRFRGADIEIVNRRRSLTRIHRKSAPNLDQGYKQLSKTSRKFTASLSGLSWTPVAGQSWKLVDIHR